MNVMTYVTNGSQLCLSSNTCPHWLMLNRYCGWQVSLMYPTPVVTHRNHLEELLESRMNSKTAKNNFSIPRNMLNQLQTLHGLSFTLWLLFFVLSFSAALGCSAVPLRSRLNLIARPHRQTRMSAKHLSHFSWRMKYESRLSFYQDLSEPS